MLALATFFDCRNFAGEELTGLALVDLDRRTAVSLRSRHPAIRPHSGAVGLSRTSSGFALLLQSHPGQLVLLDRDLEVAEVIPVPRVVDAHSLVVLDGLCLLAATGADAVVAVNPDRGTSEVVWRLPRGGADTMHINSLFTRGESLGATAFGHRVGTWTTARQGMAIDLFTGEVLIAPLFHPHSGRDEGGRTIACESMKRRIVSDGIGTLDVPLGYVRGLDVTEHHLLVGTSRGRRSPAGRATVQLFERRGRSLNCAVPVSRVDLSSLGPEVYDVLMLDRSLP